STFPGRVSAFPGLVGGARLLHPHVAPVGSHGLLPRGAEDVHTVQSICNRWRRGHDGSDRGSAIEHGTPAKSPRLCTGGRRAAASSRAVREYPHVECEEERI